MKTLILLLLLIPNLVMAEVYECRTTSSSGYLFPFKEIISYSRVGGGFYDDFDGYTHEIAYEDEKVIALSNVSPIGNYIESHIIDKKNKTIKFSHLSSLNLLARSGECRLIK